MGLGCCGTSQSGRAEGCTAGHRTTGGEARLHAAYSLAITAFNIKIIHSPRAIRALGAASPGPGLPAPARLAVATIFSFRVAPVGSSAGPGCDLFYPFCR